MVILAVPSYAIRSTARGLAAHLRPDTIVVNAGKGLEDGTLYRFSEVLEQELPMARIAVLSGPSHAEEVGRHIPTGVVVTCEDERSQHKNKARAMKVLASRILQAEQEKQHAAEAAERRSQVGSGDRSERIRTYNFPQGRVTDHRINLTMYSLDRFMEGDIESMVEALASAAQADALKAELGG